MPIPEPLRFLEPRETETRKMHALEEYGLMHVKLYEDIARNGHIATTYAYPVKVEGRYVMDPSPTPKFDNPKMHMSEALQLFGAGREQRIYALPPYTEVVSLDFEDHPFELKRFDKPCGLCGAAEVYLDEVVTRRQGRAHVRLLRHRPLRGPARGLPMLTRQMPREPRAAISRDRPGCASSLRAKAEQSTQGRRMGVALLPSAFAEVAMTKKSRGGSASEGAQEGSDA